MQGRLILLLLFVLVPVLLIQAYIYLDRFKTERGNELQTNLEIARSVARTFESFVQDVLHQELVIGLAITSLQPPTVEDVGRLLHASRDHTAVRDLSWVSRDGTFLYSSNPALVGAKNSDRSYFREIEGGREWTVSELLLARSTGEPVFGISRGIRDDNGVLLGLVVATIVPEQLDSVLSVQRRKGGAIALIDHRGMLVFRHPDIHPTWEERNWLKDYPSIREVLAGKEVTTVVYAPYEGKSRLIANTPIVSTGWIAGAGRREEEVTAPILASIGHSALLFLSVSLAGFLLALVFSRKIAGAVIALRAHALALGQGEDTEPLGRSPVCEFEDLSEAFNSMADKVRSREGELREQREWLRVTLTSIGDAVLATDLDGRITFINPVASALTGWPEEDAKGRKAGEVLVVVNEQTRGPAEDVVGRVLAEGTTVAMANHTALVSREGREIPIEDSAAPIRDSSGNLTGVVVVFHDATEKRRAQNALRESEAQLRTILENVTQGVVVSDMEGRFLYWNRASLQMHGYANAEECRRGLDELTETFQLSESDSTPLVLSQWPLSRILRGETLNDWEVQVKRSDFEWERIYSYGGGLARDGEGKPFMAVVTVSDITERKRLEEELRASRDELELRVRERTLELNRTMETIRIERQRLHDVLDVLPVYVCLLTPDHHVPFANEVFRKRFGASSGLRCFEHLFGRSEPCEVCNTYEVLKTMAPHQWEWTGPDSRNYDVFDFPFTDTDGSTLILEMGIDITERKQAEAELEKYRRHLEDLVKERTGRLEAANAQLQTEIAERKQIEEELRRAHGELDRRVQERTAELQVSNKALMEYAAKLERLNQELEEFAFVASHDLQEPLRKIQTFGGMLVRQFSDSLGEQGRDYLTRLTKSAKRMSDLLRSLREYSRVASQPNPFEPVQVRKVVEDAVSDLELSLRSCGGRVEIGELPAVEADASQLRQLFQNLISNSIKYCSTCEKPLVKIHGSVAAGMCQIFVQDNGIGFESEHVDRIFRPFQRLHGRNAEYEGTGMGLAICRKIAERHGGSITARSAPGQGTTFIVTLPVQ